MTKEEIIKELVRDIGDVWITDLDGEVKDMRQVLWSVDIENIAIELYNAGYRKHIEVSSEMLEELQNETYGGH